MDLKVEEKTCKSSAMKKISKNHPEFKHILSWDLFLAQVKDSFSHTTPVLQIITSVLFWAIGMDFITTLHLDSLLSYPILLYFIFCLMVTPAVTYYCTDTLGSALFKIQVFLINAFLAVLFFSLLICPWTLIKLLHHGSQVWQASYVHIYIYISAHPARWPKFSNSIKILLLLLMSCIRELTKLKMG